MKLKLILVTAFLSFALLLAGCSKTENTDGGSNSTSEVSTGQNTNSSSKPIVIYDGRPIAQGKFMDGDIITSYNNDMGQIEKYYEINYNVYHDGTLLGQDTGKVVQGPYDNTLVVEFSKYKDKGDIVAISDGYNAVPEKQNIVAPDSLRDSLKSAVKAINDKFNVSVDLKQVIEVDLDKDNSMEYIITVNDIEKVFSATVLLDSNKNIVAYPTIIKNGSSNGQKTFLKEFNGQIIDIDNDGIMELVVAQPVYENLPRTIILKYNKGNFEGQKENYAVIQP